MKIHLQLTIAYRCLKIMIYYLVYDLKKKLNYMISHCTFHLISTAVFKMNLQNPVLKILSSKSFLEYLEKIHDEHEKLKTAVKSEKVY